MKKKSKPMKGKMISNPPTMGRGVREERMPQEDREKRRKELRSKYP